MARPEIKIDPAEVEKLRLLSVTREEAAAYFGCSERTFAKALKRPEIRAAWDRGYALGNISLRRQIMQMASRSAPVMIHLSKTRLGAVEVSRQELTGKGGEAVKVEALVEARREIGAFLGAVAAARSGGHEGCDAVAGDGQAEATGAAGGVGHVAADGGPRVRKKPDSESVGAVEGPLSADDLPQF